MQRLFSELAKLAKDKNPRSARGNRSLRFEQCEERRLMAFNIMASGPLVGPIQPQAAAAIHAPATIAPQNHQVVAWTGPLQMPTTAQAITTTAQAVTTKAASTKIDLDVTVQSGAVVPTQAKDLNLLHFFGGEKLTVPTVVKNYGPGVASGSVTVSVYLSTTRDLNSNPVLLGQKTVNVNLSANATTVVSLDTTVPSSLSTGTKYWIVAKVITPMPQSTINDVRSSDRQFEFLGTPTNNPSAFQPDASGNILYFQFIRDTLNSRFVAIDRDITVRVNDPQSFIGSFQGDELYPYLSAGAPMIGLGINLNTLDSYMQHMVAVTVRSYYQSVYRQTLTGDDSAVINMLKVQAYSGSKKAAISAAQDQTLFDLTYPGRQQAAINALGSTIWSQINPMAKIALMDQVYATGGIYPSMVAPLKVFDYARAGFQLVDNPRTTQSPDATIRVEAEYENLVYSTRTLLGAII